MIVLTARNVNYALPQGITHLHEYGLKEDTRNGPVLREAHPVTTIYERPCERVLMHPWRDANPFFHLIEALWMLVGRDDIKTLQRYVKSFKYTDDGKTVPGAYGKRWRDWFHPADGSTGGADQLEWVVQRLRADPGDRRVVLQMWDAFVDPGRADENSKDVPCNITALPFILDGKLNLTVFCRSNDMVWGAYGANAVHFSFLLEWLAARLGIPVGHYWQVSNNFHAYLATAGDPQACWPVDWGPTDPYARGTAFVMPMTAGELDLSKDGDARKAEHWIKVLLDQGALAASGSGWDLMDHVIVPMEAAHAHYRTKGGEERYTGALEILGQAPAQNDWAIAGREWLQRRLDIHRGIEGKAA